LRLDDPELVRNEYADERGLSTRIALYGAAKRGGDARDAVFAAVAEARPRRVLEVGCGRGELAERIARELGADVAAIDSSPRMVELTRSRGIDAELADAAALPFADGAFDCTVAAWMLYHVIDLELALAELHRVLRPAGRLVAATNGVRHLEEMWRLVGLDRPSENMTFHGGNGSEVLRRKFERVERREVEGHVVFRDRAAVVDYVSASIIYKHLAEHVPPVREPLHARASTAIFVAHKAAA
jgi:SAM-dependent methyltransferase